MRILLFLFLYLIFSFTAAEEELGTIEVIGISPLPLIEKNKYPSTSQSINEK